MSDNLKSIVQLLEDKKAETITVIDISKVNPMTRFYVICTSTSARHGDSLAMYLVDYLSEINQPIHHIEGRQNKDWILVDANDILIHIFQSNERQLYNLEGLWADQPRVVIE